MREYIAPIVNMNGSASESLLEAQRHVYIASVALVEALKKVRPHLRDFQISPEGDYKQAEAEWSEMVQHAVTVADYALAVSLKIKNQKA